MSATKFLSLRINWHKSTYFEAPDTSADVNLNRGQFALNPDK
ncbi:hypothetical protein AVEN_212119-1, partial [Araneus ventricosus]